MPLTTSLRKLLFASVLLLTFSLATQNRQDQYLAGDELDDLPSRGKQWMFSEPAPEDQELRRFKRFKDATPSRVPSVASIIDNPNQGTQARPPVVALDRINQTPTREEILWREIARLREQNRNSPNPFTGNRTPATVSQTRGNPVVSNPTQIRSGGVPFVQGRPGRLPLTQAAGSIVIDDRNLEETFAKCGQFLERCLSNNQGHSHGHHHSNHSPASNRRPVGHTNTPGRLTHNPSPAFTTFNGQRIPVFPG